MHRRKTVYCEIDFLKEFFKSRPLTVEPNDESIDSMLNWLNLYKFICKSDLILNITEKDLMDLTKNSEQIGEEGLWWSKIWKKSTQGECGLDCAKESFHDITAMAPSNLTSRELNAMFLTTFPDKICRDNSERLGVIILNNNLLSYSHHLYKDNGEAIRKGEISNWNFIDTKLNRNDTYPPANVCNALIIVDPYLLIGNKDDDNDFADKLESNLTPILKSLLPRQLKEGEMFEISIFTGGGSITNFENQYNYICSTIGKIRKKLNFELTIYSNAYEFHDRSIATNNMWISCGHGFDIFKKGKAIKSTTVNIAFPFIQSSLQWCDNSFLNLIHDASKVEGRLNEVNTNCWGEKIINNRIIEYYNSPE